VSGPILITGAAGQLARTVAARLSQKAELLGADVRPLSPGDPFPGEFHQVRYTQRKMDDIFRRHRPEVLVHLGRIRGTEESSLSQRYTQNVLGTRRLLELCLRHGVKRAVVLSTFHVYGAHQHNHVHIREDEPLRASQIFPELSDAVELDHAATSFLWRYRRVETVVLRPANIVGPGLHNMISRLLRARACPLLLGYDPMMQFLHEVDAARAIELAVQKGGWGVFNVAGEGAVPWSHAIKLAQAEPIPVPHFVAYPLVGLLARWRLLFPKHLIDYFRYPVVIDDEAFRTEHGYAPSLTTVEALRSVGERAASAQPAGRS
jgi:UDP-glucose 4-epimerase